MDKPLYSIKNADDISEHIMLRLFVNAVEKGYDLGNYITRFMLSKTAANFDLAKTKKELIPPADLHALFMNEFQNYVIWANDFQNKHKDVFTDMASWIGYFYRHWHIKTGESSRLIYMRAPYDIMQLHYFSSGCENVDITILRLHGDRYPYQTIENENI